MVSLPCKCPVELLLGSLQKTVCNCLLIVFITIISCYATGYNFICTAKGVAEQFCVYGCFSSWFFVCILWIMLPHPIPTTFPPSLPTILFGKMNSALRSLVLCLSAASHWTCSSVPVFCTGEHNIGLGCGFEHRTGVNNPFS